MHIFPYSRREGTPADRMPEQVTKQVKEERAHRAAEVAAEMEQNYLTAWVGETLPVLFEEEKEGLWRGHAPNYVEVWTTSGENLHNVQKNVTITSVRDSGLLGRI